MSAQDSWPQPLVHGDRVAVIAPAGPCDAELLATGVATLAGWGLDVDVLGPTTPAASPLEYLAGDDARRADALVQALDPASGFAAVIVARGGYGSMRVLELAAARLPVAPPPRFFVGSSDTTALHAALARLGHRGSVYGPMPATKAFLKEGSANAENLRRLLFGLATPDLAGRCVIPGEARGRLTGGCLTMVAALAGTPWSVSVAPGSILLLEDVGERAYRLDRMLTTLRLNGVLEAAAGIVVGSLTESGLDEAGIDALLADRLGDLGVPVLSGAAFGHDPIQGSLALGPPYWLRVAAAPSPSVLVRIRSH